jgi:hypothetical protein
MNFKIGQIAVTITNIDLMHGKFVIELAVPIAGKVLDVVFSKDAIRDENIHIELNFDDGIPF